MLGVEILRDGLIKHLGPKITVVPLVEGPPEQLLLVPQQPPVNKAHHAGGVGPHLAPQFLRCRGVKVSRNYFHLEWRTDG